MTLAAVAKYGKEKETMAIFHFTVKIIGRSKGKSVISASAYLNGDVMKNEETGRVSYYTSKKEVVYTQLMMCENAPPEWAEVPEETIKGFIKSVRYKRAEDKTTALEKFKLTYRKQKLWNEVLKVEKDSDAQLGRSFEFALPKEWGRQEQIAYTTDYIQRNFVAKGMCADWSIHDKDDGNPHVHLLVTMRPFKTDHTWGNKEVKDWSFMKDDRGEVVIDTAHPNWWQDKKNPERHGIRMPLIDAEGNQKLDSRNRKQWKRELTDATGWNSPKNCELWRSEWAKECNLHLPKEQQIDHRSYQRQGKIAIPTIHEGADARKIERKYQDGTGNSPSWKIEENRMIIRQNAILQKIQILIRNAAGVMQRWKERLYDIRRKQGGYSHNGGYDKSNREAAGDCGRNVSGNAKPGCAVNKVSGTEQRVAEIKQRAARAVENITKYRRNVVSFGKAGQQDQGTGNRKSAMERISRETQQREHHLAETEYRMAETQKQIEKVRGVDERIRNLKARRTDTGTFRTAGRYAERNGTEGRDDNGITEAVKRIAEIKRETQQREQSREYSSIKERLEAKKRIVAEREKEAGESRKRHQKTSR